MSARGWVIEPVDATGPEWDALLSRNALARGIVPAWEELAGWRNIHFGLREGRDLLGGMVLSVQRVPYTALSLSRITCLMFGPDRPMEMLGELLSHTERYSRRHLIVETELRLRLVMSPGIDELPCHREAREEFERRGYRALSKVDTSYFVRIDRDDEDLLQSFDRSARNKIRKAQREGAAVVQSTDYVLLDDFYAAYLEMCNRKAAPVQPETLVGRGLRPILERGHAALFLEKYAEGLANMVIVDTLGVPCYVLGTRSEANVRGEVPGAAQLLQYEIMKQMRDRGHRWYDLGGCEGPVPVEGHPNHGVWRFKYGFQGQFVRFIPYMRKVRAGLDRVMHATHVLRGDFV